MITLILYCEYLLLLFMIKSCLNQMLRNNHPCFFPCEFLHTNTSDNALLFYFYWATTIVKLIILLLWCVLGMFVLPESTEI